MKKLFSSALLCLLAFNSCKKSNQNPLPTTMQMVTDGMGHTTSTYPIISMSIINQNGVTVFHADTLKFNYYEITYNVQVKPGDVLKAIYNDVSITNPQVTPPIVDIKFVYNKVVISDRNGSIYNNEVFYNNDPTANTALLNIPTK